MTSVDIAVFRTIRVGGELKTAAAWRAALKAASRMAKINERTSALLDQLALAPTARRCAIDLIDVDLVVLATVQLTGKSYNNTTADVFAGALTLGLDQCAPDDALHLRLQYLNQPDGECLQMGMKPVHHSQYGNLVFRVEHNKNQGFCLDTAGAAPDRFWSVGQLWVFRKRKRIIVVDQDTICVNLDAPSMLPCDNATAEASKDSGWVVVQRRADGLHVNGRMVILHRSQRQKSGQAVIGHLLYSQVAGLLPLHPNIAEGLVQHAHLIPEDWGRGGARILFCAVRYNVSSDDDDNFTAITRPVDDTYVWTLNKLHGDGWEMYRINLLSDMAAYCTAAILEAQLEPIAT